MKEQARQDIYRRWHSREEAERRIKNHGKVFVGDDEDGDSNNDNDASEGISKERKMKSLTESGCKMHTL